MGRERDGSTADFFEGRRSATLPLVYSDTVRVAAGEHAGRTGAVVAVVDGEPTLCYVVEMGSAPLGDITVPVDQLELLTG
ncbi:MAG: hypothetical protein AAF957_23960 [Planctomycetota bacterium]